ncbi:MAG TPA: triose-phosphate isomerase, partial [Castellaniella sp.]|nr:triose-phosphate isomerase [Castellaniella sp.]
MSHPRKRLVMGNWKMHGSLQDNAALLGALLSGAGRAGDTELAVCVPSPYLAQAQASLAGSRISWGA